MKFILKAYNLCELGQRSNQEDAIFPALGEIKDSDRMFILCDGMGGHELGEVASNLVCKTLSASVLQSCQEVEGTFTDQDFEKALSDALTALDAQPSDGERKMGTTMTFLKFHKDGCTIAHIGDSRVYHIRPGKGVEDSEILFQTVDHSLVNDLIRLGEITAEEALTFGKKNVITRAMQPHMERCPKADIYHTSDIRPGDYFMLCSDGILEEMEDKHIKFIFSEKGGNDLNKVNMLKKVTCQNHDNHSAIIVHVLEVEGSHPDECPFLGIVEDEEILEPENEVKASLEKKKQNKVNTPFLPSDERHPDHSFMAKGWLKPLVILLCFVCVGYLFVWYAFPDEKEKTSVEPSANEQKSQKTVDSSPSDKRSLIEKDPATEVRKAPCQKVVPASHVSPVKQQKPVIVQPVPVEHHQFSPAQDAKDTMKVAAIPVTSLKGQLESQNKVKQQKQQSKVDTLVQTSSLKSEEPLAQPTVQQAVPDSVDQQAKEVLSANEEEKSDSVKIAK